MCLQINLLDRRSDGLIHIPPTTAQLPGNGLHGHPVQLTLQSCPFQGGHVGSRRSDAFLHPVNLFRGKHGHCVRGRCPIALHDVQIEQGLLFIDVHVKRSFRSLIYYYMQVIKKLFYNFRRTTYFFESTLPQKSLSYFMRIAHKILFYFWGTRIILWHYLMLAYYYMHVIEKLSQNFCGFFFRFTRVVSGAKKSNILFYTDSAKIIPTFQKIFACKQKG